MTPTSVFCDGYLCSSIPEIFFQKYEIQWVHERFFLLVERILSCLTASSLFSFTDLLSSTVLCCWFFFFVKKNEPLYTCLDVSHLFSQLDQSYLPALGRFPCCTYVKQCSPSCCCLQKQCLPGTHLQASPLCSWEFHISIIHGFMVHKNHPGPEILCSHCSLLQSMEFLFFQWWTECAFPVEPEPPQSLPWDLCQSNNVLTCICSFPHLEVSALALLHKNCRVVCVFGFIQLYLSVRQTDRSLSLAMLHDFYQHATPLFLFLDRIFPRLSPDDLFLRIFEDIFVYVQGAPICTLYCSTDV